MVEARTGEVYALETRELFSSSILQKFVTNQKQFSFAYCSNTIIPRILSLFCVR